MKKCIILSVIGALFLVSCIGDTESWLGGVIIAAVCFFFAFRAFKKEKVRKQTLLEAIAEVSQLTIDTLQPISYGNIVLKEGEEVYFAAPARTFTSKERITGYTGGSRGVNVHIAKGVNFRVGNHKAQPVRKKVYTFHAGDYIVTNRRIVFIGAEDHFEYKLEKISAVKQLADDAFTIIAGSNSKNITLKGKDIVYAYSITAIVVDALA